MMRITQLFSTPLKMLESIIKHLKKGLKSAKMKDALHNLPEAIAKIRYPPLPSIEGRSDDYLKEQGVKLIIPSNKIDIYTRP